MFVIEVSTLSEETLLGLYKDIYNYKLGEQIILEYRISAKDEFLKNTLPFYDYAKVDLKSFEELDKNKLEDALYDLAEVREDKIFSTLDTSLDFLNKFKKSIENIGVSGVFDTDLIMDEKVSIDKLSFNDCNIALDFLKYHRDIKRYNPRDMLFKLNLSEDGELCFNLGVNEYIGNINKDGLYSLLVKILSSKKKYIEYLENNIRDCESGLINCEVFDIRYLIYNSPQEIVEHKWCVFNKIKNLDPEIYEKLPTELCDCLNDVEYVKMEDALPIIKGEDEFLKYYR